MCMPHETFKKNIVFVFFLLDKGREVENLQKECLFLLHYHFPTEDSSESFKKIVLLCVFCILRVVEVYWN